MERSWRSPMARLLGALVSAYRATGAFRTPRCRFYPSCSAYSLESLRVHGAVRGSWLSVRRVLRCHPWNPGGVDYPPASRSSGGHDHAERSEAQPSADPVSGDARRSHRRTILRK